MKTLIQSSLLAGIALVLSACGGSPQPGQTSQTTAPARTIARQPSLVPLEDSARIAAGNEHSVGLHVDGSVWAWGENTLNQLGTGTGVNSSIPVAVPGLSGIRAIKAGGYHTLALHGNGTVFAFGNNSSNQFGNGTTPVPANNRAYQVPGMSNVKAISAGQLHSLALTNNGEVWGWGRTTLAFSNKPVKIPGLSNVKAIASGWNHDLAVLNDGSVMAWGVNTEAQLGLGHTVSTNTPTRVPGLFNIVAVSAGRVHSMALRNDIPSYPIGPVFIWGSNTYLQLGGSNDTRTIYNTPVEAYGTLGAQAISAGAYNSATLNGSFAMVWGNNYWGQLGNGNNVSNSLPGILNGLNANPVSISYGSGYLLLLMPDGSVQAMGNNFAGQLGNHTFTNSNLPTPVTDGSGAGYLNLGINFGTP
jgi:alpha-tubulin suppressor-like RCC1 family protein